MTESPRSPGTTDPDRLRQGIQSYTDAIEDPDQFAEAVAFHDELGQELERRRQAGPGKGKS